MIDVFWNTRVYVTREDVTGLVEAVPTWGRGLYMLSCAMPLGYESIDRLKTTTS